MAFKLTVADNITDLGAGEVIKSSPHDVQAYNDFTDGLLVGRFCRVDDGVVTNIDGSEEPLIIGVPRRKVTGVICGDPVAYTLDDSVAEIITYGYTTVELSSTAEPKRHDLVNIVNEVGNEENGCATQEAVAEGIVAAGAAVFWEPKGKGIWLIRFNRYL